MGWEVGSGERDLREAKVILRDEGGLEDSAIEYPLCTPIVLWALSVVFLKIQ